MTSCGSDPLHLRFAAHANFVPEGTAVAVGEAAAAATGLRGGVAFVAAADGFTTGAGERPAAGSTTTGDEGTGALAAFQHTTCHATERGTRAANWTYQCPCPCYLQQLQQWGLHPQLWAKGPWPHRSAGEIRARHRLWQASQELAHPHPAKAQEAGATHTTRPL